MLSMYYTDEKTKLEVVCDYDNFMGDVDLK